MAGIAAVALIGVGTAGVNKLKARHEKRKAQRATLADPAFEASSSTSTTTSARNAGADRPTREDTLAAAKAREASEERRRGADDGVATHPALRGDAPPPYVRDAPTYDEHYAHPLAPGDAEAQAAAPESTSSSSRGKRAAGRAPALGTAYPYRELGSVLRPDGRPGNCVGYRAGDAEASRPRSPARVGETEAERRERKRKEYFAARRGGAS